MRNIYRTEHAHGEYMLILSISVAYTDNTLRT